jgi:hypothetical protein
LGAGGERRAAGAIDRQRLAGELELLDRHHAVDGVQARGPQAHRQAAAQAKTRAHGLVVGRQHRHHGVGAQRRVVHDRAAPVPQVEGVGHPAAQGHLAVGGGAGQQHRPGVVAALAQAADVQAQLEPVALGERGAAQRLARSRQDDVDPEAVGREGLAHSISSRS